MSKKQQGDSGLTDREMATTSGIPLQRHLAELVRLEFRVPAAWRVEAEEVPANGGFLDMLLQGQDGITQTDMRAAVEVKRWMVAHRPMRLLFLSTARPDSRPDPHSHLTYLDPYATHSSEDPHSLRASGEFMLAPETQTAQHCIFEERKGTDGMDAIARELLGQVESLSNASVARNRSCAILPMVVTNAELRVLHVGEVDLDSGELVGGNASGTAVPFLRYQKTLSAWGSSHGAMDGSDSFAEWSLARARTIFVVQAKHFIQFLREIRISPPWNNRPR